MFEQTFKNIDDILWKDSGCSTELDYAEQSSWILFLKWLDDYEKDKETKAKLEKGNITFTGTNQHGYWFNWNDKYGQGNLQLREYTDGSLRGVIYIDDGTMLGKQLGDFIGYKK